MEKYEQLKKVIQEANPEIMELKFGCRVYLNTLSGIRANIRTIVAYISGQERGTTTEYFLDNTCSITKKDIVEVLGRPIRLADVADYLKNQFFPIGYAFIGGNKRMVERQLKSTQEFEKKFIYELFEKWNLRDDNLDHQSDETKAFLIDLLVK